MMMMNKNIFFFSIPQSYQKYSDSFVFFPLLMLNNITAETNIIPAHHMDLTPIINVNRPAIKP